MKNKAPSKITCKNCYKEFYSNQAVIRKQEQIDVVRQLGNICSRGIPHELYIAECPFCRAELTKTYTHTCGVR